jgi:hypothetical protein
MVIRALKFKPFMCIGIFFITLALAFSTAEGEELQEGFKLNAGNIDQSLQKTFEGHTIQSLLTEKLEWHIREHGLEIELQHSKPYAVDPAWIEATKKYSKDVQFDPETRDVKGYKAGCPFPNISNDDPHKAVKVIWNQYLTGGWPRPEVQFAPTFGYLIVDGKRGPVNDMEWALLRVWTRGRLHAEKHTLDPNMYYKQILLARAPYDIRGIGSLRIRYFHGKRDDGWTYVRMVRRTRRISGGAWSDPIGGTDQLNDELSIFSAYPIWYPEYKFLGRRHVLAMAHLKEFLWKYGERDEYPDFDIENPPYWNPKLPWAPREVYVIEAKMPPEHVYSKRIYYIDIEGFVPHIMEAYDKKGDFVKMAYNFNMNLKGMASKHDYGVETQGIIVMDFNRMHATIGIEGNNYRRNPPGVEAKDISIATMEAIAKGKWDEPVYPEPEKGEPMYFDDFDIKFTCMDLK